MSYQVLARKYRPQSFEEVMGQEHVTTTLKNAILKDRLHHAYLFTGVRGTGKTSLARILAKSLNCLQGPTPSPCQVCSACQAITSGQDMDVAEIDGASHTSVENIRELREQVKYLPASGKYKIYIIDEVHMLSNSAFNALLKTLEEPPPHVLFVFATTEVHKIPVTILSRCQRFDLKRLTELQVREQLQKICLSEKVAADAPSLDLISRAAEGSMRDAQSLLDTAIGLCGETLKLATITEMLGLVAQTWIADLTRHCLQGELLEALQKVDQLYQRGCDLRPAVLQWVDYVHDLTLCKAAGVEAIREKVTQDQLAGMQKILEKADLDTLQIFFQTIYRASEQIFRSENPRILWDLLLVRLVHGSPYQSITEVLSQKDSSETTIPAPVTAKPARSFEPEPVSTPRVMEQASSSGDKVDALRQALSKKPQIKAILEHASSQNWDGDRFVVTYEKGSMWGEMFQDKRVGLSEALSEICRRPIQVLLQEGAPRASKTEAVESAQKTSNDPVVRQAMEILNATVKEVKRHGHE